jgi:hypothetical protein
MKLGSLKLIVACLLLAGCAYHGPLTPLPPVIKSDAAEIIVFREWGFKSGGVPITITIDGADVYALENGRYTILHVNAGDHNIITWIWEDEKDRVSNRSNFMSLTLKPGEKRYLSIRTNHNPFTVWTIVKEVSQVEGQELLAKYKFSQKSGNSTTD